MIYLSLIHYPVYNKNQEIITTTVTNLDLHDIARAGRTYNINQYYIVNPLESQQEMIGRMKDYWFSDFGAEYNPDRREAFKIIEVKSKLDEVVEEIKQKEGKRPKLVATDARTYPNTISYDWLKERLNEDSPPYLLLFGTGWGLAEEVMEEVDYILEPIQGSGDYNHLSVRSAVSIILDRLIA